MKWIGKHMMCACNCFSAINGSSDVVHLDLNFILKFTAKMTILNNILLAKCFFCANFYTMGRVNPDVRNL